MNQPEIARHLHLKKKISHYPQLPKHIRLKGAKGYKKPNPGLADSCTRGFYKRLSNWMKDDNNTRLVHLSTPRPKKEQAAVEAFDKLEL